MRTLTPPNPDLRDAVEARSEIDLRIGAAFTRWQTVRLQRKFKGRDEAFDQGVISYGPCQFPTLGFVVERFLKRKKFVPQGFWSVDLEIKHNGGESTRRDVLSGLFCPPPSFCLTSLLC